MYLLSCSCLLLQGTWFRTEHKIQHFLSPVTNDHQGLLCDTCNIWLYAPCQRVGNTLYDYLSNSNCSWHCTKCSSINYSLCSVSDLRSFASVFSFNTLHSLDNGFQPASSSTPTNRQSQKTTPSSHPALIFVHINFQSPKEKKLQFFSVVELNTLDSIIGTETWLTNEMFDSEFSHQSLDSVYRRNRISQKGGGVIMPIRSTLSWEEKSEFNSDCENLWSSWICWIQVSLDRCLLQVPWIWPAQPGWIE